MKTEYNIIVKKYKNVPDSRTPLYRFFNEAKTEQIAKDNIYKLIQRKNRLFKEFLNVPVDDYIVEQR